MNAQKMQTEFLIESKNYYLNRPRSPWQHIQPFLDTEEPADHIE